MPEKKRSTHGNVWQKSYGALVTGGPPQNVKYHLFGGAPHVSGVVGVSTDGNAEGLEVVVTAGERVPVGLPPPHAESATTAAMTQASLNQLEAISTTLCVSRAFFGSTASYAPCAPPHRGAI